MTDLEKKMFEDIFFNININNFLGHLDKTELICRVGFFIQLK